jgi:hypothetical protein
MMRENMRAFRMAALLQLLLAVGASAQTPQRIEAVTKAEQAAYDKALCVHEAITMADRVFFPEGEAPDQRARDDQDVRSPAAESSTPEQATARLDSFSSKSREGVRSCLTERDVYDLGRYSFLEDKTMHSHSGCAVSKAPAARFGRTPNNSDGDIVNGAAHWVTITDAASIAAHPFFQGQSEARATFAKDGACGAIVDEYGPTGSRFPGMVRPGD